VRICRQRLEAFAIDNLDEPTGRFYQGATFERDCEQRTESILLNERWLLVGTVQTPTGSAVRVAWPHDTAARGYRTEGGERPSPALLPGTRRLAHGHLLWRSVVRSY
jgi:hypothetical protein